VQFFAEAESDFVGMAVALDVGEAGDAGIVFRRLPGEDAVAVIERVGGTGGAVDAREAVLRRVFASNVDDLAVGALAEEVVGLAADPDEAAGDLKRLGALGRTVDEVAIALGF